MNRFIFRRIINKNTTLLPFIALFFFSSCNLRQARVINKIINEVDNLAEDETEENQTYDSPQYDEPPLSAQALKECPMYTITGVYQNEDNGRVSRIDGAEVIDTGYGLYRVEGLGILTDRVYNNDIATITEVFVVRWSFDDDDEVDTRPFDVSMYKYKCYNGSGTAYFNIADRIR